MSEFIFIDRDDQLASACGELLSAGSVAVDTEFMRVRTYFPTLCLVQLRGQGVVYLLDPLVIENLSPLRSVMENRRVEVVLHSCRQDLEALETRFPCRPEQLFDTQIAAAFCGMGDQVSYAALVETAVGVSLPKAHTRADWSRRPLQEEELSYAAEDVLYLRDLRDFLGERLCRLDRMTWFLEECRQQLDPRIWNPEPEQAWTRLKGGASLPLEAQETARQLAIWRERRAARIDLPREWVLPTQELLAISREGPASEAGLFRIPGISSKSVRRQAKALLRICRETPRNHKASPIWTNGDRSPENRNRVKEIMKVIREAGEEIGISPSLLANRSSVEDFVQNATEIGLFRGWRREVIGDRVRAEYS